MAVDAVGGVPRARPTPFELEPQHISELGCRAPRLQVAAICTALLVGTAYQLLASAFRIFKKFELQKGELVRLDVRSLDR